MKKVSWLAVLLVWIFTMATTALIFYFYVLMLPDFTSAPLIKAFFEGPQIYLLFILLVPALRRLLYLSEYPRFVRDNIKQLIEKPQALDSEFQRLFIRFDFKEAILLPIIPAMMQVVMSGSSIFAFGFPWIFYLMGEVFILGTFIVILKMFGQVSVPLTLFKLHLISKPKS
ncbi:hypothetical protein GF318_05265 [Candidatus Micrarchaeota archaeon]|nr:hypothetical protein [Candidatus Micrarchaeota archaeon]